MTLDSLAILTFCDGQRREPPVAQVLLTRWELGVLGYALRWPLASTDDLPGGRYLAAAAQRYAPASARARGYLMAVPDGDAWAPSVEEPAETDDGDSGYWLDAGQVRRLFANLSDRPTREAIVRFASGGHAPSQPPDRLIACLQMLAQATERGMGIHFAYYLC